MRLKTLSITLALLYGLVLTGCTSSLRNTQLERVAKDWALVVRASQVIPVYPLSEDLQPGDILLVSTPVEEQVELYKKKGFLPLDQHLARLYPDAYMDFYQNRYLVDENSIPPGLWQQSGQDSLHRWEHAPLAAFPSYQFHVKSGSGLNLAIPVKGVPFALGLMNTGQAYGSISITDAYTFGIDNYRLYEQVQAWSRKHRDLLSYYAPAEGRQQFLRVISRVYLTGGVNIMVHNDDIKGGNLAAGDTASTDKPPVDLIGAEPVAQDSSIIGKYSGKIKAINDLAKSSTPGGNLQVVMATNRRVSLDETFARPLVIGYVGFDMPVLEGGRLGAPISTLAQLSGTKIPPPLSRPDDISLPAVLASAAHMYNALAVQATTSTQAQSVKDDLDRLSMLVPPNSPVYSQGKTFDSVLSHIDYLKMDAHNNPQHQYELEEIYKNLNTAENRRLLRKAIDCVFFGG